MNSRTNELIEKFWKCFEIDADETGEIAGVLVKLMISENLRLASKVEAMREDAELGRYVRLLYQREGADPTYIDKLKEWAKGAND